MFVDAKFVESPPHMGVSENGGTPQSSIFIGFSITNHPFWGTPIFGNPHIAASGVSSGVSPLGATNFCRTWHQGCDAVFGNIEGWEWPA